MYFSFYLLSRLITYIYLKFYTAIEFPFSEIHSNRKFEIKMDWTNKKTSISNNKSRKISPHLEEENYIGKNPTWKYDWYNNKKKTKPNLSFPMKFDLLRIEISPMRNERMFLGNKDLKVLKKGILNTRHRIDKKCIMMSDNKEIKGNFRDVTSLRNSCSVRCWKT